MSSIELFPPNEVIGVFRGFSKGGLEFHADLVLPYRNDFQSIPMHGQFLLVQLETQDEAVLGRITSLSSSGKLSSGVGEEFNIRAMQESRAVPEDLREQYLKYQVDIRVLGVLRIIDDGKLTFVASHRRLPHVGSLVAFLSGDVLREIASHNVQGAAIGHFALGEYIYSSTSTLLEPLPWMQIKEPEVLIKFPMENLVSRRSFIFARAGFGKSNLNKLLFSELYKSDPVVEKRQGRRVPVGTILFDPDGEYFWPDDKGRPGLCDVKELENKLVVFTNRRGPSNFYDSFVAGGIKLDIRRLNPSDVISIAISPEKQGQQNIRKLSGLRQDNWSRLVDLVHKNGNQAELDEVKNILGLEPDQQDAEALAARANMTTIVRMLHDNTSQLLDMLLDALKNGKLCIVDISQMRGSQSLILSSLILRRIFDHNQEQFTAANPETIPTLAVVEEAQSVLSERATGAEPYIAWVKEGRKYDLGAVLITQQPGSISNEILSQGDNWFIFHLLSASDLNNIKNANAHFSQDILSALLNEPIPGQGVFWSSSSGKPFPIALRVLLFEKMHNLRDPDYSSGLLKNYAQQLKKKFQEGMIDENSGLPMDVLDVCQRQAIQAIKNNLKVMENLEGEGIAWGSVMAIIKSALPKQIDVSEDMPYKLVAPTLNNVLGPQGKRWESFKKQGKTWIRKK
ncbi:ATP-binding protein [Acaryochloris marina]|uniref:Helicase HerA central domain-containing protein n=1 Tax=Acaryochloris marina (strain MBIC 11017) TaxID=329726 RepID=B0C372_ACAM1|nr:DUF87 domain-containing protein [Acaryochloris marina]ABW27419.1 conserved hypothetical protein [Acaryochloris marina MBIC11017]